MAAKEPTRLSSRAQDLTGFISGKLTAISWQGRQGRYFCWLCSCECGGSIILRSDVIAGRKRKDCGCVRKEKIENGWRDRFWKNVAHSESGCWEWQGSLTRKGSRGYGTLCVKGKIGAKAHRLSYEMHFGPIPDGMCVCHRCDNPRCVRPDHLFLGTHAENMQDCSAKGRQAQGERVGMSKLTAEQVIEMRKLRSDGLSLRALARRFGTDNGNVHRIISGKSWKHIPFSEG